MAFQDLISAAQQYFSDLQIKYKDQSLLMKIISKILFFNKTFITNYTTTIGSTVYFPSQSYIKTTPVSSAIILMHELMHIKDAKRISKLLFGLLYLSPQILILLFFPLLFISWKIALLFLIFGAPIPSYFRMYFEKRAYFVSLYVLNGLSKRLKFDPQLNDQKNYILSQFSSSYYYFMWPFKSGIKNDFEKAIQTISAGNRPFDDNIFDILDNLINKV